MENWGRLGTKPEQSLVWNHCYIRAFEQWCLWLSFLCVCLWSGGRMAAADALCWLPELKKMKKKKKRGEAASNMQSVINNPVLCLSVFNFVTTYTSVSALDIGSRSQDNFHSCPWWQKCNILNDRFGHYLPCWLPKYILFLTLIKCFLCLNLSRSEAQCFHNIKLRI